MVSLEDSHSHSHSRINTNFTSRYTESRPCYYYTPPPSSAKISRSFGRSMRTIRSNIFQPDQSVEKPINESENLTDSFVDLRLGELANKSSGNSKSLSSAEIDDILDTSRAFSDFSACSSDISGELRRLATLPESAPSQGLNSDLDSETCAGFLQREAFSSEIIESISPEDLHPTVKLCVDGLQSPSIALKRSAAAKLRLLAKNRADNRALIGEIGAVPALIPLLRCPDPTTQEHAVTALLNLSLHETNKLLIMRPATAATAVKSLIYNAACALLSLSSTDDNKLSIGACGAIPPLIALLINGSNRGKKDALTTLYKLCSVNLNKERAVSAGAARPLVGLVGEQGTGLAEKAMVVLSSLAGIEIGAEAIVEEGGIGAFVEAIEDGSNKGKEFAVSALVHLCAESVANRGLLVREGAIPPLVALSQTGTAKAKHKAETLLRYLRESRQEGSSSTP
ncbi:hypothetical protein MIMGU_mgv1a006199mg [Erythranthe guttata]|uniref:U-box domain-containing protein n=1 Tax=Erythranthe guttata TaxID=4155 RepID=A0A022R4W1_ERYGU|nr:hypothetical protein MIMGU_mgv1a006199mg [Erythranthe guttata]